MKSQESVQVKVPVIIFLHSTLAVVCTVVEPVFNDVILAVAPKAVVLVCPKKFHSNKDIEPEYLTANLFPAVEED